MATSPPVLTKKLWNIVRIVFFMIRKGISKRKLMMDLHLMMKRGKIATKAIGNLMFNHHHHHNFSCRSTDVHPSSYAPREYEFSCSNSPAFPFNLTKKNKNHPHFSQSRPLNYFSCKHPRSTENDVVASLQKTLEILNYSEMPEASPIFSIGPSPIMVRQLRITDSPFPLKNADEDSHVDKEAEEFIERFYEQLRLQKRMAY